MGKPIELKPEDCVYYFSADGILSRIGSVNSPEDFLQKNYWETRRPIRTTIGYVQNMMDRDIDVRIFLTYFPESKTSKNERVQWILKYFPYIYDHQYILLPFGTSKLKYARPNTILVSTNYEEIEQWTWAGGLAVQGEGENKAIHTLWKNSHRNLTAPFDEEQLLKLALNQVKVDKKARRDTVAEITQRKKDFETPVKRKRY